MELRLELIIVPVSDVDRAKEFYRDQTGFTVDVDHRAGETFRVVQLTPPGSHCSISFGTRISRMEPGSLHGMHLVVADIERAREELVGRGVDADALVHFVDGAPTPGVHPDREDYGTFCSFRDPDGNTWVLQEVGWRTPA